MEDSFDSGGESDDDRIYSDFFVCRDSDRRGDRSRDLANFRDVSLRRWIDDPRRSVRVTECVHIFRQIINIVRVAHSNGILVRNIRPSCLLISSLNRVSFVEYGLETTHLPAVVNGEEIDSSYYAERLEGVEVVRDDEKLQIPLKWILDAEKSWYLSPEEAAGVPSSSASDMYRLGVFFFELLCGFSSKVEKMRDMYCLKNRSVPPSFLRKWPEGAATGIWMLHPDPNCRPTMGSTLERKFATIER